MSMKSNILVSVITAAVLTTSASVIAYDGTIKFTGEILDAACTIDIGAGNSMTVSLGKVNKSALSGAGSLSDATKFTIKVKNCPESITSAVVKFDGEAYAGDNSVLQLTQEEGAATGVGIQLSDSTQKALPLYTASSEYTLKPTEENDLDFYARYIAKADKVTAGPANSVATFTMNYN